MKKVIIHSPIWATKSVGVADHLINDDLAIYIDYKKADGELLYPDPFFITKDKARSYPTQKIRGTTLHIIPLKDCVQTLEKYRF